MRNVIPESKSMYRRLLLIIVLFCLPIAYTFYLTSSLIALIFEDGLEDAVNLQAIAEHANRTEVLHPIPKIIHQTWKNDNIPEQWEIAQYTWYTFLIFVERLTLI